MKAKSVLDRLLGTLVCVLLVVSAVTASTPVVVTNENLVLKDASGNVIGIVGLNTTVLYCTAIDQLTSGQGVKLYRLVVENGSSFPASPVDKQFFYRYDTGLLYVYNASSWNPVGSAPSTYPYANITGVPDLSGLLAQNGSRPLLNNWNTGSYGIYGLTYVSTVGTVYCAGLSNVTLAGYVNTTRLLVETSASAPATPASGYVYFDTAQNNLFIYNGTGWMALGNASSPAAPDLTVYLFDNGTRPLTANWNTGSYGLYGMTWVNTTNLNIAGQLWWNGYNRTDIIAHPQDSFNFLVYSEGGMTYARTGNTWQVMPSTIQACVDAVTASGGSIIVKNGTYSEAVSLKNATRLVLDRGCVGVTVTIASGATAILEDYNSAITWVWSGGVLVMQYNNINGLITGIYANFNQYWSGAYNRTDAVVNPYGPYSYIIDLSGSTYRMRNGTTGQVDFQSTNLTLVEQFASGNLTSGLIYLKEVVWNTALGSPADNVMIVQQYQGEIRYISSQAKFVLPQLGADPNTTGWTQTQQGRIWYNTGEDTMKYWNGSAIVIMPSIGGGGASYDMPYKYTVYLLGSTYYAEDSRGNIGTSGTDGDTVTNYALSHLTAGRTWYETCWLRGNLTVNGEITPDSWTILEGPARVTLASSSNCHVIYVNTKSNVIIRGLTIDGNENGQSLGEYNGVQVTTSTDVTVEKVKVYNARRYGIAIGGTAIGSACSRCDVKDCYVEASCWNNIIVSFSTNVNVESCISNYASDVGINTWESNSTTFSNCISYNITKTEGFNNAHWCYAFEVGTGRDEYWNAIVNCIGYGSSKGLSISNDGSASGKSHYDGQIIGCRFYGNSKQEINFNNASRWDVESCYLADTSTATYDIVYIDQYSGNITLSSCTFYNGVRYAIQTMGDYVTVTGCRITYMGDDGINLNSADHTVITSCQIHNCAARSIDEAGTSDYTLLDSSDVSGCTTAHNVDAAHSVIGHIIT